MKNKRIVILCFVFIFFVSGCSKADEFESYTSEIVTYEEESNMQSTDSIQNNNSKKELTKQKNTKSSSNPTDTSESESNNDTGKINSTLNQTSSNNSEIKRDLTISEAASKKLKGIKVNAIGDSYFAGNNLGPNNVWVRLFADKYNIDLHNYGINGCTISDYFENLNPICTRYVKMQDKADIVIFEGGHNDYSKYVPLGTKDSTDSKTFAGAVNILIDGLRAKYPNSLLLGITSWYVNPKMKEYSNMMLSICASKGVKCFDAADKDKTGVHMDDIDFREKYSQSINDTAHLNLKGAEFVEPVFEKFIADAYLEYK